MKSIEIHFNSVRKTIITCFLLVSSFFAFAQLSDNQQKEIDSLYHQVKTSKYDTTVAASLVKMSEVMYIHHVDTIIPLCNKAIEICEHNLKKKTLTKNEFESFKITKAGALNNIGYIYGNYGNLNKQLEYYEKSLKIREGLDDQKGIASTLNNVGYAHKVLGNYKKAIEYYFRSLKIKDKIGDKKGVSSSYLNIGVLYETQGEIDKALEYYQKVLILQEELNNLHLKAIALNNIANVHLQRKDFDKSFEYNFKSLKIREEIHDNKGIANSFHNIGLVFKETRKLDSALKYYHLSLEMKEQQKDLFTIPPTLTGIGYVWLELENMKKAKEFALRSYEISRKTKVNNSIMGAAKLLQVIYSKEKNFERAYEFTIVFFHLKDSLVNEDNKKAALKQNMQYEYDKKTATDSITFAKEKEIKEVEIAKQKAEIKAKRNQQYGLFGGLALVILFAGFIFNRLKVTQKQKIVIEEQKHLVEEKNKEIIDSITYAKRIQEAILPSRYSLAENLKNGFVLFKPKDVVSGDFYWLETLEGLVCFAAADCTGHGVPGAMVSVVCSNALSKALLEEHITESGKLLDRTRELVIERFDKSEEEVKDGMDISLCCINYKNLKLQWSGANNPLWMVRNGELIEHKHDKQPIGFTDNPLPFTTHIIELQKNDTLYIFTDGFQDQFGGEKGKKYRPLQLKEKLLAIQNEPMDEQKVILEKEFENWRGDLEQVDDVCVIGVRI